MSEESLNDLRRQAEERLAGRRHQIDSLDRAELAKIAHELAVHQVELEIQNEELRWARTEAEEARDRYLDLYDFAPVGYFTLDDHNRIVEANLVATELLKTNTRRDLLKTRFTKFIDAAETNSFHFHRTKALESEDKQTLELRMRRADGTPFDAQLVTAKAGAGRLRIAVIDATERKRTEKALSESEKKYRLLFQEAKDGIVLIDAETGGIVDCNPEFEKQTGRSLAVLRSMKIWELRRPEKMEAAKALFLEVRGKGSGRSGALEFRRPDGQVLFLDFVAQRIDLPEGRLVHSIVRDVTEQRRADQLKDDFIGMVSHELRTPLTVIIGAVHTAMNDGRTQQEIRELLQDTAVSAQSLAGIIDNLLDLSRYQEDGLTLDIHPVDIGQIARAVVDQLKDMSAEHELVLDIAPALPAIEADRIRVERILHNLVGNAIKYSPKGGEVRVSAQQENRQIIVKVQDEGIGISPENQAQLFEPFQRFETETSGIGGVGLGLIVCRRLVEAHRGRIWVESQPGKGSCFCFTLPIAGT